MRSSALTVASLCFLVGLPALPQARAQTDLRWRAKPGATYRYVATQTNQTETEGLPVPPTNIEQVFNYTEKITKVASDGSITKELTFDRIQFKLNSGPFQASFDTAKPDEGNVPPQLAQLQQVLNDLAGQSIRYVLDSKGKVKRLDLPEAFEKAVGQNPAFPARENIRRLAEAGSLVFPDEPVQPGSRWSATVPQELPFGTLSVTTEYTYAGKDAINGQPVHKITLTGTVTLKQREGSAFKIELLDPKLSGAVYLSEDVTHIVRSEVDFQFTQRITNAGQTFTQKVRSQYKVELAGQ